MIRDGQKPCSSLWRKQDRGLISLAFYFPHPGVSILVTITLSLVYANIKAPKWVTSFSMGLGVQITQTGGHQEIQNEQGPPSCSNRMGKRKQTQHRHTGERTPVQGTQRARKHACSYRHLWGETFLEKGVSSYCMACRGKKANRKYAYIREKDSLKSRNIKTPSPVAPAKSHNTRAR